MKKRNPLVVVLLSIITFGIYDLYWLVKTKKVLNEKTKFHTPTIWLLILPYTVLIAGYILLFTTGMLNSNTETGNSFGGSSEQINAKGSPRPSQYVHKCTSSDGILYVTQGNPNCLGNDSYQGDYGSGVPGTLFSSPCKTTSGTFRYVYIAQNESCPSGTSLEFYNNLCSANAASSADCNNTDTSSSNNLKHPGTVILAFGLIFVGFILVFTLTVFWLYRFSKAINEYTNGKMSTAVTFLILWLIHLVGVALIQDTFNDMEELTDDVVPNNPPQHSPVNSIYPSATTGIGSTPIEPQTPTQQPSSPTSSSDLSSGSPAPIVPLPSADQSQPDQKPEDTPEQKQE